MHVLVYSWVWWLTGLLFTTISINSPLNSHKHTTPDTLVHSPRRARARCSPARRCGSQGLQHWLHGCAMLHSVVGWHKAQETVTSYAYGLRSHKHTWYTNTQTYMYNWPPELFRVCAGAQLSVPTWVCRWACQLSFCHQPSPYHSPAHPPSSSHRTDVCSLSCITTSYM